MPAADVAAGKQLTADLVKLGPGAIKEVARMIVAPGTGDDSKARFAMNGLAFYVTRPGAESERAMYAAAVIEVMKSAAQPVADPPRRAVNAFFASMLQLAGKEESVAPLAKLLADPELCEPATMALVRIRTPGVVPALAKALPAAKGPARATILRALGDLRAQEAVQAILPFASDADANTRHMALFALANIGDPAAADVLAKAVAAAVSPFERAHATALYLKFAQRLAERGDKDACAKICRGLIQTRAAPRENNVVCDALATLYRAVGDAAVPDILSAVGNPNKQLRAAALELAIAVPGEAMTARIVEKMKQAPADARPLFLAALGRRADKAAAPAVLESLKDADKAVRLAAVESVARSATPEAVAALLAMLQAAPADEAKAAQDALGRMPGDVVGTAAAAALAKAEGPARVALLNLLAAQHSRINLESVFTAAGDKDAAVRIAAAKALAACAGPDDAGRIIAILLKTPEGAEQTEFQRAVVLTCQKAADAAARADAVLAALAKTTGAGRVVLLRILPQLAGQKAVAAAIAETKSTDAACQDAAVRALADWRTPGEATAALLDVVRTAEKPAHQVLALRGYLRLVGLPSDRPVAQTVQMYKDGLAAAKRPDEKRLVIGGLSAIRDIEALKLVATLCDDPSLGAEAALAALKIVLPQKEGEKPLQGADVLEIVKRIAANAKDPTVRSQAEAYIASGGNVSAPQPPAKAKKGKK
jgi:HEAT repeat protein